MTSVFAIIATLILAALAIFQLALILGAPLGRFAWGGQHTALPAKLRVGSAVSIVLYVIFAVFILSAAGISGLITDIAVIMYGMYILTGYFTLGILMNAISRSKPERFVMTPISATLAILFFLVTVG